jgi:hypothetical protein
VKIFNQSAMEQESLSPSYALSAERKISVLRRPLSPMTLWGHSRPGRASLKSGHVRYAAEGGEHSEN